MLTRRWVWPLVATVGTAAGTAAGITAGGNLAPRERIAWTAVAAIASGLATLVAIRANGAESSHRDAVGISEPARPDGGEASASTDTSAGTQSAAQEVNLLATLSLSSAALFTLAVWFRSGGAVGATVDVASRTLLGLGAYVLPIVGVVVGVTLLGRPPPRLAELPRRLAGWRSSGADFRARALLALKSLPRRGLLLVGVAAIGLLHIVRLAPPPGAPAGQLQEAGGVVGSLLATPLVAILTEWGAAILLFAVLLQGSLTTAFALRRRRGAAMGAAALLLCLAVPVGGSFYLYDYGYRHWVVLDGDAVTVVKGLAPRRSRVVNATGIRREAVPAGFLPILEAGISVHDRAEGLRVAELAPRAFELAGSADGRPEGRTGLRAGTCLTPAEKPTSCSRPHAEEVYRVVGPPYPAFPGAAELQRFAAAACRHWYQGFAGIAPERSGIPFSARVPSSDLWDQGSRSIACVLRHDASRSLRGARLVFEDGFADPHAWSREASGESDDGDFTWRFEAGRVTLGASISGYRHMGGLTVKPDIPDNLRVEAVLTAGSGTGWEGGFTVEYRHLYDEDKDIRHLVVVDEDGHGWILKARGRSNVTVLAAGQLTSRPRHPFGIELTRQVVRKDTVRLRLSLNGRLVVRADDTVRFDEDDTVRSRDGRLPENDLFMTVGSNGPRTRVSFDRVSVAEFR